MGGEAIGGIGQNLIFFMLLIGSTILGLYAAAYAAQVFLVTVDNTATGFDEVDWPDEPYLDWIWKLGYALWLVTLWAVPLLFYSRYQWRTHSNSDALTNIVLAFVVCLWLLFPLSLLSSMLAPSRWVVIYPPLLTRLLAHPGAVAAFYFLTGPILAAGGMAVAAILFVGPFVLVPAGACALTIVLLMYGRALGAFAAGLRDPEPETPANPKPKKRKRSAIVDAAGRDALVRDEFVQPADRPPVNAPDPEARVGYNVRFDEPHAEPPPTERRRAPDFEEGQYDMADAAPHVDPPRAAMPDQWAKPSDYEMSLARGKRSKRKGGGAGIVDFPFRVANRGVVIWLTMLFAAAGLFARFAIQNAPGR